MVVRASNLRIATWKYASLAYVMIVVAGLVDLWITLKSPVEHSMDKQSGLALRVVAAGTVIAQMGIWYIALKSAVRFMRYIQSIQSSKDGKGMIDVARALLWLIVYIVVLPLTSSIAEKAAHKPHGYALVILHNYVPLLAMIAAVGYLYRGSRRLMSLVERPVSQIRWRVLVLLLFSFVAVWFAWNFSRTAPNLMQDSPIPRFVLPLRVLFLTYVLPHLVVWLFGLLAIMNLWQYSTQVDGSIYRHLFRNLYKGIFLVFVCTFIVQLIIEAGVTLSTFNVGELIIYAVLIVGAAGYLFIYRGVQQLLRLESVS
ncbi:MAG: hypothetical protein ABIR37_01790 [Candidatus Saccharimonadales bacterium]